MPQLVEEVDDYVFLHGLLDLQEQIIVQEIPVPSLMCRATQLMDVELVLNVPVLHMNDEDLTLSKFLGQVSIQEISEVPVPSFGASMVQDQVIVQSMLEVTVHVPLQRVQQRTVEQVVDAHILESTTSGRMWNRF